MGRRCPPAPICSWSASSADRRSARTSPSAPTAATGCAGARPSCRARRRAHAPGACGPARPRPAPSLGRLRDGRDRAGDRAPTRRPYATIALVAAAARGCGSPRSGGYVRPRQARHRRARCDGRLVEAVRRSQFVYVTASSGCSCSRRCSRSRSSAGCSSAVTGRWWCSRCSSAPASRARWRRERRLRVPIVSGANARGARPAARVGDPGPAGGARGRYYEGDLLGRRRDRGGAAGDAVRAAEASWLAGVTAAARCARARPRSAHSGPESARGGLLS